MKNIKRVLALVLTLCLVIPMCMVAANADDESVTNISFAIPNDDGGYTTGLKIFDNPSKSGGSFLKALNPGVAEAAYATTGFLPVAFYTNTAANNVTVNNAAGDTYRMAHNGLLNTWFAFKIKVPSAGTYEMALTEYVRRIDENDLDSTNENYNDYTLGVYVVDGVTATDEATLTGLYGSIDAEGNAVAGTATPIGFVDFAPTEINALLTQNVLDADGKNASFTVTNASNECLVVVKVVEKTGDQARLDLTGITLTKVEVVEPTEPDVSEPAEHTHTMVHMDAVEPACHYNGNIEYWYCSDCESFWADEALTQVTNSKRVILPATGSENLQHVEAVAPACHYNGNIEYWYCSDCDGFWADEALTQVTNSKSVILPATGSENLQHVEAIAPACHYNGNIEYWYCSDCEGFWADEALTQVTNSKSVILPATGSENLKHVEAVASTCWTEGNVEYWHCPDCEGFWLDEACTRITNSKSVILPASEHGNLIHFDAVKPGCHSNGNIEYWYCPDCEGFWADKALTQVTNSKSVILPATGSENLQHFEAVAPACHYIGNIEYWYCPDCEGFWANEALTQVTNSKSVNLPATGSENLKHVEAVASTCWTEGNVEYWHCPDCEGFWLDEACTRITNSKSVILPASEHGNLIHFDAVKPGCHSNGNIEYWYCPDCEGFWADEALTQITNSKSVILPATGSENVVHFEAVAPACHYIGNIEYWYCPDCEGFWANEALTQVTNSKSVILPATGSENLQHVEAIAPACHYNGNIEYWYCPDCEGFWANEALTQVTNSKSVILPATGSENVVHFEAVEPGCHSNGNIEYWYCPDCEGFWANEALTQVTNSKSVNLPATGSENLKHVEAVASTCWTEGNVEYWYCPDCEGFWLDEACTRVTNSKSVMLPVSEQCNLIHVDAVEAGCHQNGSAEYWYCADCEAVYTDADGRYLTNRKNLTVLAKYELVHMDAVEPCHANGTQEFWFCPECEAVFADAAGTILTNRMNLTIPADSELAHFAAVAATTEKEGMQEYWYCADCDCYFADAEGKNNVARLSLVIPKLENPKTGETSLFVVMAALLVSAMGVVAVIASKKRIAA